MMNEKKGKVVLVGAGPGDIGLLTGRARNEIDRAEVIIYDALVSAEILATLPSDAELINAGKRSSHHLLPQYETNRLLLEKAQEGKYVVRLKGGDPFVFGRGGEELELLAEHDIPFEVVPGITSAVAVPAYNGIPVTHRDFTSSFHVITGHKKKNGRLDIDFEALVRLDATLVFLMGISEMENICSSLIRAGMPEDMPAAVLERGTTCRQRRVIATVSTLKEEADKAGIGTPAIILVGRVANLAGNFAWFEKKPLFGRQYLITRPREKASRLAGRLRELGAQVIELPTIETRPLGGCCQAVREMLKETAPVCTVFTSPRGVDYFFADLQKEGLDIRKLMSLPGLTFAALGQGTAGALRKYGVLADYVPDTYSAADLGRLLVEKADRKGIIYLYRAKVASRELTEILTGAGMNWRDIPIYETSYLKENPASDAVRDLLEDGEIDGILFTSASTVEGFNGLFPDINKKNLTAVCIGHQTEAAARKYGMTCVVSEKATLDSMTECLLKKEEKEAENGIN